MVKRYEDNTDNPSLDAILARSRYRSDGVLCNTGLSLCKTNGIETAFDPLQGGWIPSHAIDDVRPVRRDIPFRPRPVAPSSPGGSANRLRSWLVSDVARYHALLDDPALWDNMPETYPHPLTLDQAAALIEIANNSNHHQVFAILNNDLPVGQVRIEFDDDGTDARKAEISYWIGRTHWGHGIASRAVTTFASKCLDEDRNLHALTVRVKTGNAASLRVLHKAGFVEDGPDKTQGWIRLSKTR